LDVVRHNNPNRFPDPEAFKPSRRYTRQLETVFSMFGFGPRACIGRKFSMMESVCFLAHFVRDRKVDVHLLPDESREAR